MFTKLLAELADTKADVLAKSTNGDADDAAIQAAGATGGDAKDPAAGDAGAAAAASGDAGGAKADKEPKGGEGGEGGEDDLGKSFQITLENGEVMEAMDATKVLETLSKSFEALESDSAKAIGVCVELIKSQQTQIDSLTASVRKLSASGNGRQAVLSIMSRGAAQPTGSDLAKGGEAGKGGEEKKGLTPTEFLAKSEQAFNAGKLAGKDLSLIETHINRGEAIPAHLIQKVSAAVSLA